MMYRAFFDRSPHTVDGFFTLQQTIDGKTTKIFDRLPARSGQRGHTKTNWTRGKSPCPYGEHLLWLTPRPLQMEPVGTDFFPISSFTINDRLITAFGKERWDVGLHMENKYPGSAGCIVLVDLAEAKRLFKKLKEIGLTQKTLPITVT